MFLSDPELATSGEARDGAAPRSTDAAHELWNTMLEVIAEERQQTSWRYADGIKQEELAFFLRDHLGLDLGSSITAAGGPAELSALPFNERSDSYEDLVSELQAIRTTMQVDERPEEIGVLSDKLPA